ncbi:MAG: hypothetical protein ONB05_08810, partial [candidate division KSB1 bacterium]|nr:hypothetical protein [candidate division KSB1 bacterium]
KLHFKLTSASEASISQRIETTQRIESVGWFLSVRKKNCLPKAFGGVFVLQKFQDIFTISGLRVNFTDIL